MRLRDQQEADPFSSCKARPSAQNAAGRRTTNQTEITHRRALARFRLEVRNDQSGIDAANAAAILLAINRRV